MVTGLLDSRLAQFESDENLDSIMPEEPSDESRIQMIADALANDEDLDTADAEFGMANVDALAEATGMMPEELSNMLRDYISLNEPEATTEDGGFDSGMMGEDAGMEIAASRTAKKKLPAALEKFKFDSKKAKSEMDDEDPCWDDHEMVGTKDKDGKEVPNCVPKKSTKSKSSDDDKSNDDKEGMLRKGNERKSNRKIVFTDAKQLSASAVEAARAAGDEELVRATLAARAERRVAIGQLAAQATLEQLTREAKSKRKIATAKTEKPKEVKSNVKNNNKTTGDDFVKPTELSSAQKSAFASKALALGFPESYVTHMVGNTRSASTVSEDAIRQIAEGNGSYKEKATRVAAMIREAKLDEANKSRIMKFWVEELGYPADYVSKLVEDYKA
jgi:hypothetical protein